MKAAAPYIIRHVQLEKFPDNGAFSMEPGNRYFFSCWWRNIPMGQFFIEDQDQPINGELEKKLQDVIGPTLKWYLTGAGMSRINETNAFKPNDHCNFSTYMDAALEGYTRVEAVSVDISVIICTRNRSKDLQRCLQSLAMQTGRPREIIVVDNAPSDDSTKQLVAEYPHVIYCREPLGGLSIARNTGLRKATGEVIAFTDDDVILHPDWLYHIWRSFRMPGIYAMTGLVIPATLDTESQQLFEKEWSFSNGFMDKFYDSTYFRRNLATGPRVWDIGAGANMAFRRKTFEIAGYFDERLGAGAAGCSEDSEMWYRILAAGLEIQYNPRAVVYHEHRKELTALYKQLFSYMRGHAAAALIQQQQIKEAGYRRYLYKMLTKGYLRQLTKNIFKSRARNKMLLIQVRGIFSGVLFYIRNRNKPAQNKLPLI